MRIHFCSLSLDGIIIYTIKINIYIIPYVQNNRDNYIFLHLKMIQLTNFISELHQGYIATWK